MKDSRFSNEFRKKIVLLIVRWKTRGLLRSFSRGYNIFSTNRERKKNIFLIPT